MDIRPIKTESDYESALAEVEELWTSEPAAADADRLDVLTTLIAAYEEKHHPVEPPDPVEAIRFRMEQEGLSSHDLEQYIGSGKRVSEILNRTRELTLPMIRRLHEELGIPADVLIRRTQRPRSAA